MTEQPHLPRRTDERPWSVGQASAPSSPTCSEEAWLGNGDEDLKEPRTNLALEAEHHATLAVKSLENGELDAGIAWLQSALAFAQNVRHARDTEAKALAFNPTAFSFTRRDLEVWP